jgi:Cys-rich four helix bundle protein (predicted Tat secretion target)
MTLDRRAILAGSLGAALVSGEAAAQIWPFRRRSEPQPTPAQHQGHGAHQGPAAAAPQSTLGEEETAVIHVLAHCDMAGQACLTHCLELMAQGDATLAACARGVREMLGVCQTGSELIQSRSSLAAAQLAVCRDACGACRAACLPHVDHHATCSACAEACTHAMVAIDALLS